MNDTIAIIGTPVVLLFAKKHNINLKLLLFALAFAVTIGTVMSPIGNPQNLLIAINGNIHNPFITFAKFLLIPTLINLFLAYLLLRIFYRKHFHSNTLNHNNDPINDPYLAKRSQISLFLIIILVFVKIISSGRIYPTFVFRAINRTATVTNQNLKLSSNKFLSMKLILNYY